VSTRLSLVGADISSVELAFSSALPSEPEARHVLRDGKIVAVLRTLATGSAFTVVAEITRDAGDTAPLRPYTFERREDASAFVAEVANSFAYLGCEIRPA
jgi:hypothetical protein